MTHWPDKGEQMRARGTGLCPVIVHGSPMGSIGYWKKNAKQVGSQKSSVFHMIFPYKCDSRFLRIF